MAASLSPVAIGRPISCFCLCVHVCRSLAGIVAYQFETAAYRKLFFCVY